MRYRAGGASNRKRFPLNLSEKHLVLREQAQRPGQGPLLESIGLRPCTEREFEKTKQPVFTRLNYLGAYVMRSKGGQQRQELEDALGADYVMVDDEVDLPLIHPTDTAVRGPRPHPERPWPEASGVHLARAQGISGDQVKVAILDTGCDNDHVQFGHQNISFRYVSRTGGGAVRCVRGFDPGGHGTHVSGIVAGKDVGVAPNVSLLVASVLESETSRTSLQRILAAMDWVLSKIFSADDDGSENEPVILNFSFGFREKDISQNRLKTLMKVLRSSLQIMVDDFDVLPIVAIGNEGKGTARYPGLYPEVLSVGAVDYAHKVTDFSGSGNFVVEGNSRDVPEIVGYGHKVFSALERTVENRSRYAEKSGTSMAAPYVTGIAALYASQQGLKGIALRNHLLQTAMPLHEAPYNQPAERVGVGLARFV